MRKSILYIFFLLTSFPLFSQEFVVDTVEQSAKKSYLHLLHTDITRFDEDIDPEAWILVGNVSFRRDSMYMYCDSAHYYQKRNSFQAFGNVKMEQGDTLFLYGDYLDFNGVTNLARVRNNVKLIDKTTVLVTDSLDFDRNRNKGYFFEYGNLFADKLKSGKNIDKFATVFLGNFMADFGRNNSLYRNGIFGQSAVCASSVKDIVQQKYADIVARHKAVLAVDVYCDTYAVTVGVGSK